MDDETLSSILTDEPTQEASEPEAVQAEQSERARDPATGKFVSASDPGDETPEPAAQPAQEAAPPAAQQEAVPGHIPVKALQDERQKRQQLEADLAARDARIAEYDAYYAQQQRQQPQQQYQQPDEIPDRWTDPDGYDAWRDAQIEQRILQRVEQYGGQVETSNLVRVSQLLARSRHEDYDTVVSGPFMEAVKVNPMLVEHLKQAEDPAMFAYNAGKQYEQAKQYGSTAPVSRDAIEAEIRQKIMDELGMSQSKPTAPSSLASERSVASRSAPAWGGPPTLNELLG